MSIEKALIAKAMPHMVAIRVRSLIADEIYKGCQADISTWPVMLEPYFTALNAIRDNFDIDQQSKWMPETKPDAKDVLRLQAWVSPEQEFCWNNAELFLKQLQNVSFRIGFEVFGNNKGITINFICNPLDQSILKTAFEGEFSSNKLTSMEETPLSNVSEEAWKSIVFQEFFPSPPYFHLLTRPQELQSSPLKSLLTALSFIEAPAFGIYQALLQPVSPEHNWHINVEKLLDIEFNLKLQDGIHASQRYAQQNPSGDLKQMSWEIENKAHNDKPFFSLVFRVAIIGANEEKGIDLLNSMTTFTSLFQHGGRPLNYLAESEFQKVLSQRQICEMFTLGLAHRNGFLVNSSELTGPIHIPHLNISEKRRIPLEGLETLPVQNPKLLTGTWIGACNYAGINQKVCIPSDLRPKHLHTIGRTGVGKSTLLTHMILSDISEGYGVALIEPHGDLIEDIVRLIPEEHVQRVIYFDPGDHEWVPLWNPLKRMIADQDIGRTCDDIVHAIRSFVSGTGWGDRLEHLLRNIIFSLMHLPESTFLDLSNMLRNDSNESEALRKEILKILENETARQFWMYDYKKYRKDDLGPPRNKLSKLLVTGTVSLMLSQPESRFNFRNIMDDGMIFLANFSTISTMLKEVLGCFILSHMHQAALSRSSIPISARKPFHIYIDEAHRFMTDTIEDLIAETRKYGVSLNLAHQYLRQFGIQKTDALSSVGSSILFNVGKTDASYLVKDLRGLVTVDDLVSLETGEAISRIGIDIVRIKTSPPFQIPSNNFRDRIIEESRRKYCMPVGAVKRLVRQRSQRLALPYTPLTNTPGTKSGNTVEEFTYDEF